MVLSLYRCVWRWESLCVRRRRAACYDSRGKTVFDERVGDEALYDVDVGKWW